VQQDEGTVKLDQALIDQQKLNVTYCHIVSPVTGRIGLRLVDPGNYLQTTNTTGVAVVTQLQPITVIFPVRKTIFPTFCRKRRQARRSRCMPMIAQRFVRSRPVV